MRKTPSNMTATKFSWTQIKICVHLRNLRPKLCQRNKVLRVCITEEGGKKAENCHAVVKRKVLHLFVGLNRHSHGDTRRTIGLQDRRKRREDSSKPIWAYERKMSRKNYRLTKFLDADYADKNLRSSA